jgi:His-Xaa-Ser system protein HxsD
MTCRLKPNNAIEIIIDAKLYSSNVIHKCLYWYGNKYNCDILLVDDNYHINISLIEGNFDEITLNNFINLFKKDLIDFKTREIISTETRNIREILLVKAFANGDEFDQAPPGEIEDPVGFNPYSF